MTGAAVGLLGLVLGIGALGGVRGAAPTAAAPTAPGMLTLLGHGLPAAAPGNALLLQRVIYQPGDVVPPHIHAGAETFYVESGTYALTVLQGDAYLTRAIGATPTAGHAAARRRLPSRCRWGPRSSCRRATRCSRIGAWSTPSGSSVTCPPPSCWRACSPPTSRGSPSPTMPGRRPPSRRRDRG